MITIKLNELLEKHDKSKFWLAKEAKTATEAIYKLVNGKTEGIKFDTLDRIMEVLTDLEPGITLNDVIHYEKQK